MNEPARFQWSVAILGAGASSRMGRPKLLLPWKNGTVIGHQVGQWRDLGASQVAVVHARGAAALMAELDRIGLPSTDRIENSDPARGMFSSVQAAAAWPGWDAGLTHWLIALGDQPHLDTGALRALIEFAGRNPAAICQPSRAGRGRHPVVLPREEFHSLSRTEAPHLKAFLQSRRDRVRWIPLEDPGLDLDLDTPSDYEQALAAKGRPDN